VINKKNKSLLIIIPARLDSTRLRKKLIRKISGVPMILRVAQSATKTNLGDVIVATDSKQIQNLCKKQKVDSIITPTDIKSGTDRVYYAYEKLRKKYDLIVNLQGDLPIFNLEVLKKTVNLFNDKKTEIGSAICDLHTGEFKDKNIVKAKVILDSNNEGFAIDFCRIIENKEFFYHHIGLYIYSHDSLKKFIKLSQSENEIKRKLEQMRAMDNNMKIKLVKVKEIPPSVDTLDDLKKIRLLFRKNK
jgi:3-deoxy-manno-octulosonate cytidylyltransferase (CMP-KDO synthetase)